MPEIAFYVEGDFAFSIWKHAEGGHLCGYLGEPPGHPWHGRTADEIDADVHGGLTYFGQEFVLYRYSAQRHDFLQSKLKDGRFVEWTEEDHAIFDALPRYDEHEREEAFPHDTGLGVWWIGFDCAHSFDTTDWWEGGERRDEGYVRNELRRLADQAATAYREVTDARAQETA